MVKKMQKNKIMILAILTIFTVVLAGSASAFDLGFLSGDDEPTEVTIEGIKFNIPSGFQEDKVNSIENETAHSGTITYTMNGKTYENAKGEAIAIVIADYGDYNVTDEILSQVADDKKTVNGVDGYVTVDNNCTVFAYEENGDLVTVTTTDDSLLETIVVA